MSLVEFTKDQDLGIVTFNDPPLNLLGVGMLRDLSEVMALIDRENIRGLLLRVEEGNFSAGADAGLFSELDSESAGKLLDDFFQLIYMVECLPYPTMAAVRGMCIGGGFELALCCDFIWSADTARFAAAEALLGIVPLGGGARMLAQRAGTARAKEVVFSGRFFNAETFEKWNVVNRVLPDADLNDKALKYMKLLAEGPTLAHNTTKKILNELESKGSLESDRLLREIVPPLFESEDVKEGVKSFLSRGPGKATFNGR